MELFYISTFMIYLHRLALLWGETQLCLTYVRCCLLKEKKRKEMVTYSYPQATHSGPKITYSDPETLPTYYPMMTYSKVT